MEDCRLRMAVATTQRCERWDQTPVQMRQPSPLIPLPSDGRGARAVEQVGPREFRVGRVIAARVGGQGIPGYLPGPATDWRCGPGARRRPGAVGFPERPTPRWRGS